MSQPDMTPKIPEQVLCFQLGGQTYGIDILSVQEIRSFEKPTRIAGAPTHVLGVTNLRGAIVPLVDLRISLGLPPRDVDGFTVSIVLSIKGVQVGCVVDTVSDVLQLSPEKVKPAPDLGEAGRLDCIQALAPLPQGDKETMVILLEPKELLAHIGVTATA